MSRTWWFCDTGQAFTKQLAERFPTDGAVDWKVGDAKHRLRKSDHNPDPTSTPPGVVRAIDVRLDLGKDGSDHDPRDLKALQRVADAVVDGKDPRVLYVIFNRQIASSYVHKGTPAWTWRPYSNARRMPHTTHVHVSFRPAGDHDGKPLALAWPQDEAAAGVETSAFRAEFNRAVELGITDGTRRREPVTREQAAVMVLRALKLTGNVT